MITLTLVIGPYPSVDCSERRLSIYEIRGTKFRGENVLVDAAGDIVTTATPPSSISVETGMTAEEGMHY